MKSRSPRVLARFQREAPAFAHVVARSAGDEARIALATSCSTVACLDF